MFDFVQVMVWLKPGLGQASILFAASNGLLWMAKQGMAASTIVSIATASLLALWVIAGIAYPVSIDLAGGSVPSIGYLHLFASLVLCGLIATAYPFFFVTLFSLRVIYPRLLRDGPLVRADVPALKLVQGRSTWYLASGLMAPMLGILTVLFLAGNETEIQRNALIVFAVIGLFGFAMLFGIYRRLQNDIDAVLQAMGTLR
ncbi:MAG: hypothetical protein IID45_15530 [Planctomycetes bacterium]|nr:hypothetical protein [Planctomycetota bacterium]